jgi:hypothetical protein
MKKPTINRVALGKYSLPKKGSNKLSPALAAKLTQVGEISFALRMDPLKAHAEQSSRIRALLTPEQVRIPLEAELKQRVLFALRRNRSPLTNEKRITAAIQKIQTLSESELIEMLKLSDSVSQKDFIRALLLTKPKKSVQGEFKF